MSLDCVIYCAFYSILFRGGGAFFPGHGVFDITTTGANAVDLLAHFCDIQSYRLSDCTVGVLLDDGIGVVTHRHTNVNPLPLGA